MAENLNWVKERFRCSLGEVFEKLKAEVKEDVAAREELRPRTPAREHYAFKFTSTDRTFTALLEGNKLHKSVEFSLEDKAISVRTGGHPILSATVTLNDEGRCVVRINNKEYERWQIRKMALEALFFSDEPTPDWFAQFGGHQS